MLQYLLHVASSFWEVNCHPGREEISHLSCKCKGSLSCSQESTCGSNPEPDKSRPYAHIPHPTWSVLMLSTVQFSSSPGYQWIVSSSLGYHSLFSGVSQNGTNKSANFSMLTILYTMKEFSKSYNGHMQLLASLHYMNGFCIGYKLP